MKTMLLNTKALKSDDPDAGHDVKTRISKSAGKKKDKGKS